MQFANQPRGARSYAPVASGHSSSGTSPFGSGDNTPNYMKKTSAMSFKEKQRLKKEQAPPK